MVKVDFETLMASKSDEGLQKYIDDSARYQEEAVDAAISELKKKEYTVDIEKVEINTQNSIENNKNYTESKFQYSNAKKLREKYVYYDGAPSMYSLLSIRIFTILGGSIFGSVMLAINIKKGNKGYYFVLLFGILYAIMQIVVLSFLPQSTGLTILTNLLGLAVIEHYFWNTYIGKDTEYTPKPIWKPLIIAIIITAFFLWAAFSTY